MTHQWYVYVTNFRGVCRSYFIYVNYAKIQHLSLSLFSPGYCFGGVGILCVESSVGPDVRLRKTRGHRVDTTPRRGSSDV